MVTSPEEEVRVANKFADHFTQMAERVRRIEQKEFSGAMLYVPPTGDPIAVVIADPTQDNEAFLALCLGKLDDVRKKLEAAAQGFGRR